MQSQVYYLANPNQTQVIFSKILTHIITLYWRFVPSEVRIDEISIYKSSLMRFLLLAISSLTISQSALDFAVSAKFCSKHSTYALFYGLRPVSTCSFGLIDSFPCTFCQPIIRNLRASLLSEVADISYNATKKIHYYGIKFSVLVSDSGFPIDYVVTSASVSDGMIAFELLKNSPLSVIYGDKGYS